MALSWSASDVCMCRFTIKGKRAGNILNSAGIHAGILQKTSRSCLRLIRDRMMSIAQGQDQQSHWFPVLFAWELINGLSRGQSKHVFAATEASLTIKELIDESYSEQVHINELADRLSVNRSTLFRQFKQEYGLSPKAYMDQCRFERAKELLEQTSLSIGAVATQSGFADQDHFSRRFKQLYGQQPSQWRLSPGD